MVSLWPFKGEDNSPASFEKALATLSTKISRAITRLDLHRQHARRFRALWTLYTTFIYLLYSIILALVLGWRNWGLTEYAAIVGGPVLIYLVRAGAAKYYDYRISKTQQYLDGLQKQRDETIEKLKVATKYDSTQQLLEKYAGESPRPRDTSDEKRSPDGKQRPSSSSSSSTPQPQPQQRIQRTGLPPPPTANIRRPPPQQPQPDPSHSSPSPSHPSPLQHQSQSQPQLHNTTTTPPPQPPTVDEPGFAPNAFPAPPQYIEQARWYDRLLDVLLGEDETQPKNRIALICAACRLVNGQAPPGVKSLEELGRWRCGSCGAWNGEESAATKVIASIQNQPRKHRHREQQREQQQQQQPTDGTWDSVSETGNQSSSLGDVTDEGVMVPSEEDDHDQMMDSQSEGADTPNEEEAVVERQSEPEAEPQPKRATRRRGRRG